MHLTLLPCLHTPLRGTLHYIPLPAPLLRTCTALFSGFWNCLLCADKDRRAVMAPVPLPPRLTVHPRGLRPAAAYDPSTHTEYTSCHHHRVYRPHRLPATQLPRLHTAPIWTRLDLYARSTTCGPFYCNGDAPTPPSHCRVCLGYTACHGGRQGSDHHLQLPSPPAFLLPNTIRDVPARAPYQHYHLSLCLDRHRCLRRTCWCSVQAGGQQRLTRYQRRAQTLVPW